MLKSAPEPMSIAPEILAKYEPVIGLEVHVQLLTKTKIFCGCSTRFGDPPNTNVCPVCLGLPGTLPVLNKRAVEMAMRASLALNCTVHERSRFARKNYFYPDLPKGYQISQYELPLATGGFLDIEVAGARKRIGITRLHLEEDAAKNLHEGFSQSATKAYIDYNRCGTPLVEIVSEPDIRSSEEAYVYLTALRQLLRHRSVRRRSPHCHQSARRLFRFRRESRRSRQSRCQLDANRASPASQRFRQGHRRQPGHGKIAL